MVATVAQGTYHCLDMPANGAPDGGVDLADYLHFLKVRMPGNGMDATAITYAQALLLQPECYGGQYERPSGVRR